MRMNRGIKAVSIACCLLLAAVSSIPLSSLAWKKPKSEIETIRMKMRQSLIKRADLILIGVTENVRSRYETNEYGDDLIVSDVRIRPEEILKGRSDSSDIVLNNLIGGTVGNMSLGASHVPVFAQGERVSLFLKQERGGLRIIDGESGKSRVNNFGQLPEMGISVEQLRSEVSSITGSPSQVISEIHFDTPDDARVQKAGDGRTYFILEGHKWPGSSPEVPYYIKNSGFNDAGAGNVAQQNAAINNAANAWTVQGRANFRLVYSGTTSTSRSSNDGKNVVIVRNVAPPPANPNAWAFAYWWWNGAGEIVDSDIVFFDTNTFSINGAAGTGDIQSIATEEFGHFVGLAHSGLNGSSIDGFTSAGTISDRTLHLDDMDGLKSLYGARTTFHDQAGAGENEAGDLMGSAIAVGDFFDDGFLVGDIAVGAPGEDYNGSGPNAGVVFLYSNNGSSLHAPVVLTQSGAGANESGDKFGSALAKGDFNSDGLPDLVVGAPGEDYSGSGANAGIAFLFTGNGNGVANPTLVRQSPTNSHEAGDLFGSTLAVGDFNNDGLDDLVVGAPGEATGNSGADSGAIFLYLSAGARLGAPRMYTQRLVETNEAGDKFGSALAVGDFNSDGYADLAVGAPGENYSNSGANAGVVYVFFGADNGLGSPILFDQRPSGGNEAGDKFGSSLAAGDFDGDGDDDLAAGAPGENYVGTGSNEGVVFVFINDNGTLTNSYVFGQGLAGANESGDLFGSTLVAGDFNLDGFIDLAIGAPGENYSGTGANEGVVFIRQFTDDSFGGTLDFLMVLAQGPAGGNESGDKFGSALAVGKMGLTGEDHLVIGAPGENYSGSGANAGIFYLWR